MATTQAQLNAGAKAFAVLWQDYLDNLAAGTKVCIHFAPSGMNGIPLVAGDFPTGFATDSDATRPEKYVYTIKKTNSTDNMIYFIDGLDTIGGIPLFFKVSVGADTLADI